MEAFLQVQPAPGTINFLCPSFPCLYNGKVNNGLLESSVSQNKHGIKSYPQDAILRPRVDNPDSFETTGEDARFVPDPGQGNTIPN